MTNDLIEKLGPLAALAGTWEGDKGLDIAPDEKPRHAEERSSYRERMMFEPFGPVNNHEQCLYGLRYYLTATRLGEEAPFHEDMGYWLWDAANKQVIKSFVVPRGVAVIAGGTAEAQAKSFKVVATPGSETYGICSNMFLHHEFRIVGYEQTITIHDKNSISYAQDTQLLVKGQENIFHHTDKNTLTRVK